MTLPVRPRDAVLAATVECAGRVGLGRVTVEEVARDAGVSRATVYRWFPGGRDQLVDEAITWEVGRFLRRLVDAVAGAPDLASRLERGIVFAHQAIEHHQVLRRVLEIEPGGLLPQLRDTAPLILAVIRGYLVPLLRQERLRAGVDADDAADYLARMILSFIGGPGRWRLDDPRQVAELVSTHFLAGVIEAS